MQPAKYDVKLAKWALHEFASCFKKSLHGSLPADKRSGGGGQSLTSVCNVRQAHLWIRRDKIK